MIHYICRKKLCKILFSKNSYFLQGNETSSSHFLGYPGDLIGYGAELDIQGSNLCLKYGFLINKMFFNNVKTKNKFLKT